jgi:hypothetical protein
LWFGSQHDAGPAAVRHHVIRPRSTLSDEDFAITPFDPKAGIWFKHGRVYSDRDSQIAEFEDAIGFKLPNDFLEMIGEYCEGGFDGHYRVYFRNGVEVQWHHLLLIKLADEVDVEQQEMLAKLLAAKPELAAFANHYATVGHDSLKLIRAKPELFGTPGGIRRFPFGEAYETDSSKEMTKGYLAFDAKRDNMVVFMPETGGEEKEIARSFREMMLGSSFVFYG